MLKRIIDLDPSVRDRYDTSSLRMVTSGAAPLPPELATAVIERFGEILYNGYASTEVGAVTLATPADLKAAPGTVGRTAGGVTIKLLDDEGIEVARGKTGRIFVGSPMLFDGYTGGGGKEVIDGLMSTGDLGHFDRRGRLFIDGRDDDMILSAARTCSRRRSRRRLIAHPAVADASVFGVPDPEFGQRLASMVVRKPGGPRPRTSSATTSSRRWRASRSRVRLHSSTPAADLDRQAPAPQARRAVPRQPLSYSLISSRAESAHEPRREQRHPSHHPRLRRHRNERPVRGRSQRRIAVATFSGP